MAADSRLDGSLTADNIPPAPSLVPDRRHVVFPDPVAFRYVVPVCVVWVLEMKAVTYMAVPLDILLKILPYKSSKVEPNSAGTNYI